MTKEEAEAKLGRKSLLGDFLLDNLEIPWVYAGAEFGWKKCEELKDVIFDVQANP